VQTNKKGIEEDLIKLALGDSVGDMIQHCCSINKFTSISFEFLLIVFFLFLYQSFDYFYLTQHTEEEN